MPQPPAPDGAVVFDCDGTLVATQGIWNRAYAALFAAHGRTLRRADRHRLIGLQLSDLGHELARLLGLPGADAALGDRLYDLVATNLGAAITPTPGAIDLVTALAHSRPLAVASNTPRSILTGYLTTIGLADAFTAIVGCDDVAAPKPAPDVYLTACSRLHVPPREAVAIEDSPIGAAAARAAGLYVIGIPSSPDLLLPADTTFRTLAQPALRRLLVAEHVQHSA